jgi:hypothetical protein
LEISEDAFPEMAASREISAVDEEARFYSIFRFTA